MLTMLVTDSVTIKYEEYIKLMRRQLMSVSQDIIKVRSFCEAY